MQIFLIFNSINKQTKQKNILHQIQYIEKHSHPMLDDNIKIHKQYIQLQKA